MTANLRLGLLGIVAATIGLDLVWQVIARFDLDWRGFLALAATLPVPLLGGLFYTFFRKDERIATMFWCMAFILTFSPAASLLTYFSLSVVGPNIDRELAQIDRFFLIDWPALVSFVAGHPWLAQLLRLSYVGAVLEVIPLLIWMGWRGPPQAMVCLCLALAISFYLTLALWLPFPSAGAVAIYGIPQHQSEILRPAVDGAYARHLMDLFVHGPGKISPGAVTGVIGFPSYHAAGSIILTWFAARRSVVFAAIAIMNILSIIAAPVIGGHHVIDILGGVLVAIAAIAAVQFLARGPANKTDPVGLHVGTVRGEP